MQADGPEAELRRARDVPGRPAAQGSAPDSPPPPVPDHELLRRIGGGSYGEVWLARSALGALRAVKIVHRAQFDHDRPFEREFNGLQKFEPVSRQHAGLVDILHVGRAEGCFYYVMELADDDSESRLQPAELRELQAHEAGPTSDHRQVEIQTYVPRTLRLELQRRGRLPVSECLTIGRLLAEALDRLHHHGLVHRDVKPSNIIFVDGVPKLADIGLVVEVSEARSFVGTTGYIPPEGPGTPQADLYSLGKVLYEMCTGRDRHDFPQMPSNLRELPEADSLVELNEIVLKACDAAPSRRYPSAAELRADLALLETGGSVVRRHRVAFRLTQVRWAALGLILAAALGGGLWQAREFLTRPSRSRATVSTAPGAPLAAPPNSVAVLRFGNESPDPADDYLGESLAEAILNNLAHVPGLKVPARNSAFAFQPDPAGRSRIAERLQVRTLLEGAVRKTGAQLDLAVWLVGADRGGVLWSNRYVRPMSDLFAVQREVAEGVTQTLDRQLAAASRERGTGPVVRNPEAYDCYLRGRYFWNKRSEASLRRSVELFQAAVTKDDQFALAYAGLADAWMMLALYGTNVSRAETLPLAKAAVRQALRLDDTLGEAHATLGLLQTTFDWRWSEAEVSFQRAIALNPTYATAHHWYAFNLAQMGRIPEALASLNRALQIDPQSLIIRTDTAWFHLFVRQPARSIQLCREVLEMDSTFQRAYVILIAALDQKGETAEAVATARELVNRFGATDLTYSVMLARALARNNQSTAALQVLAESGAERDPDGGTAVELALCYVALGETLRAIEWLERIKADRAELRFLQVDWRLDPLRADPRFQKLLADVGLK